MKYINRVRIGKAKEMMACMKELSLDKIAKMVGYKNQRTFFKVFRKLMMKLRDSSETGKVEVMTCLSMNSVQFH
ncbi:hypothetical protein PRIO_5073 [Paenibacillus riograndensis SBR5]|uniref:HTH araC/xylS-type domain-containing protein n=2 Tax=Paenibacillus riograndensis TaxID=483937 RepID=A0A0E4HCG1_9BACL|nr:hypothetical protein PRIO_5073 [Paenibacillus riograndensis SBR5]